MTFGTDTLWHVAVAVLGGLAVGIERQWSGHASGDNARFAGLRTFTLMGLVAGISGWWWVIDMGGPALVLLAATSGIILLAYAAGSRRDVDATTEIAAIVVLAAGVLAGAGQTRVASSIIALTVLLLVEKSQLHRLVGRLGEVELLAAARFAAMALVVLPLLPQELGPFGWLGIIRPRQLWALVLFFSGLSFLGYVARRVLGERKGYAIAGVLGGLASSTSVTLTFSRLSRSQPDQGRALASGVLGANVMVFPRVLLACVVLAPPLAQAIWPAFLMPVVIGLVLFLRGLRDAGAVAQASAPRNPLELGAALQMVALFQVILIGVSVAERAFGDAGLYGSAAVLGLSDVDALTISMAQRVTADTPALVGATALTVGIFSNTVVKTVMAFLIGRGPYRILAGAGLLAMAVALLGSLLLP